MALGMEVGLGPGDFVFDGDPAPPEKPAQPHRIFGPRLLWPNGWMDEDAGFRSNFMARNFTSSMTGIGLPFRRSFE